jgi:hypothetical protein
MHPQRPDYHGPTRDERGMGIDVDGKAFALGAIVDNHGNEEIRGWI